MVLLAAPLSAGAQQGERVYRIGLLSEGVHPLSKPLADALREFGWIEVKNLKYETRSEDSGDQLPTLGAELVRLKVDLILTNGTRAARAAKEATKTVPIVFSLGEDPVANGLVTSFARPGGNLTGFVVGLYDEKTLEILKEALPALRRVAYPAAAGPGAAGFPPRIVTRSVMLFRFCSRLISPKRPGASDQRRLPCPNEQRGPPRHRADHRQTRPGGLVQCSR
jgi:hypothetical protein